MDQRPDFGESFDNSPDGEIRQWMARVGALMRRVGIREGIEFDRNLLSASLHWESGVTSLQVSVLNAIEALRLDLELNQDDPIGTVYETNQSYDFLRDIVGLLRGAEEEVFVVDPYFDVVSFTTFFSSDFAKRVRILCSKDAESVSAAAARFEKQTGAVAEVRKSKMLHDRLFVIDGQDCWVVGASIKDAGRKPTYLLPLVPELSEKKVKIYVSVWESASTVSS